MLGILLMSVIRAYATLGPVLRTAVTLIMHNLVRLPCCYY